MKKLLAIWLLLATASFTSQAQALSAADKGRLAEARAARAVVEGQLQALADGNAVKAYSYASPTIRTQFRDAEAFMNMVRVGYPMVIRPTAMGFFQPEFNDGALLQTVQLRDQQGRSWRATYELRKQADKRWRINGCVVVADDGLSTI